MQDLELKKLLDNNKDLIQNKIKKDKNFFNRLANTYKPKYL